jgi:prepilin-type processing-associated H-X9-DG protein
MAKIGRFLGFHHPSGEKHIQASGAWVSCAGQDNTDAQCIVGDVPNIFDGQPNDHIGVLLASHRCCFISYIQLSPNQVRMMTFISGAKVLDPMWLGRVKVEASLLPTILDTYSSGYLNASFLDGSVTCVYVTL